MSAQRRAHGVDGVRFRLYGFPDVYFMTGAICATLQGLLSEKPKRIDEIIPFFASDGPADSPRATAATTPCRRRPWMRWRCGS